MNRAIGITAAMTITFVVGCAHTAPQKSVATAAGIAAREARRPSPAKPIALVHHTPVVVTSVGSTQLGSNTDPVTAKRALMGNAEQLVTQVENDPALVESDHELPAPIEIGLVETDPVTGPIALTLEHLASIAMAQHPTIAASHARIAALRGKWLQAGLPPNPTAQYSSQEIGNDSSTGLHQVAIGQTFVTANKLRLQRNVVAFEIRQAEAQLQANRLRVQTDVQSAFVTALLAQQRLDVVHQLREIADKSLESVEMMVRFNEVSQIALLQAQTESQQTILAVETATAALDGARRQLASVVAMEQLPPTELAGEISEYVPDLVFDSLAASTIATSPEIADRMAAISRARQALNLACAQVTPNVKAQVGVGYDSLTDDTYGSIQVSVPLPIINRNQGNIQKSRAEIQEADRLLQRAQLDLSRRLAAAFQTYETARRRSDRIRDEIIPRAEKTLSLSVLAFEAQEASYLQLLTVQRTLFESRLRQLDATAEAARSANLINGYLLSGSLESR